MIDVNITTTKINALKSAIERGKTDRAKAEANKESYEKRLAEIDAEITALGFAPDNVDTEIEKLGQQINSALADAQSLIPHRYLQG